MDSRQRFLETMQFGHPDRVPYFEEGLRNDVLRSWRRQGLRSKDDLASLVTTDKREEIELEVEPRPMPHRWPANVQELKAFARRLDPADPARLPPGWRAAVKKWRQRDHVLMMRLHRGFFLTMGVRDWRRFRELMELLHDDPGFVRAMMALQADFVASLTDRLLQEVSLDAAIFSEPIGADHGSLISPRMYADFVLTSYRPVLDVLRKHEVKAIILRTYANACQLVPVLLQHGFNCLWACEVNTQAMDYRLLRREFGADLRLIGGIDLDVLRQGREAIRREVEEKVPPLIAQGGYVPLADGRVRSDIRFEDYLYYRRLLQQITTR
jgi:hypothetical protein